MEKILSKNLINLKDSINSMILNSSDKELKSFYNSSIGRSIFDICEISHSTFNYTAVELVDEVNLPTAKEESSVISLANEHSYHLKHKIPATVKCRIKITDPNDTRWDSISKIVLNGGEFVSTIGDFNFAQLVDVEFNKSSIVEFNLHQAYKKTFSFNISRKGDWSKVLIEGSKSMTNYINTGLSLDAKLYKIEDDESETEYNVLRSVPTESDLDDGNFVMSGVTEDKELNIMFGNGVFGNRGIGNYRFEFFETKGDQANYGSPLNTTVSFSTSGISAYDINGNEIINSNFAKDVFEIITVGEIIGGEDVDNKEDIRYKAMKSSAINNVLLNSNDFNFTVKENYGIDNVYFWGDNVENRVRKLDQKENFNLTFFTSIGTKYDFDLPESIRYNLLSNSLEVSESINDYNPLSFDIVPDCDRFAHRKLDDCLSFKTLYILGRIKPIHYYYMLLNDDNSVLCNIMKHVRSKSNDLNFAFIEADTINVNVNVNVSGSSILSDNEVKTDIINYYNNKNTNRYNIDSAIRNSLAETNYSVNSVQVVPTFSLTRFNTDINSIMITNGVGEFDRYVVANIIDTLDISLKTYYKVSDCLQGISNFIDRITPYIKTSNKEVIKSLLIYSINKYNETKSNVINSGNLTNLDIPLIQFNLTSITLIKE